jgi:hypothetical protein
MKEISAHRTSVGKPQTYGITSRILRTRWEENIKKKHFLRSLKYEIKRSCPVARPSWGDDVSEVRRLLGRMGIAEC